MDTVETLERLGISLALGLLVGLQRERKGEELAGIRTFALLTLFGTIAGLVGKETAGSWMVAAGAVAVGAILATGAYIKSRSNMQDIGLTTEVAALVMYGLGAYLAQGEMVVAVVLAGAVVSLLYWKQMLHGFVRRMGDKDVAAIMEFVLISLVVLPVLPREKFGPYEFFNPFETWLVVVFVVGLSLVGYVLYKLVPPTAGALLGGAVGGLISSTATTVSYARRSREEPASTGLALQAIMVANTVSVGRVMVLVAIFAGEKAGEMIPPLATMAGAMGIMSVMGWWMGRHASAELAPQENPTELKTALIFAAIYTAIKFAVAWGKSQFGTSALYVVGAIAGLTDMDAITLSMSDSARAAPGQSVAVAVAWRVVLLAVMSNLIFKAGTVYVLGSRRLKGWVTALFAAAFLAGAAILVVWR